MYLYVLVRSLLRASVACTSAIMQLLLLSILVHVLYRIAHAAKRGWKTWSCSWDPRQDGRSGRQEGASHCLRLVLRLFCSRARASNAPVRDALMLWRARTCSGLRGRILETVPRICC